MPPIVVTRAIAAPVERVFDAIADVETFARAVGGIEAVTFLAAQRSGVGTRYRTTRAVGEQRYTMEFVITECVAGERVRIVNETQGTVWDTIFDLHPDGPDVIVTMTMAMTTPRLLARLMIALARNKIRAGVARDLDALKAFCERPG